jgi:hypothetical protein
MKRHLPNAKLAILEGAETHLHIISEPEKTLEAIEEFISDWNTESVGSATASPQSSFGCCWGKVLSQTKTTTLRKSYSWNREIVKRGIGYGRRRE